MLDDQEVKKLLLRTAARDEGSAEAFERLYRLCAPLLLGVAQRVVGRREVAEEVLHDAFAAIWRKAESFDPLAAAARRVDGDDRAQPRDRRALEPRRLAGRFVPRHARRRSRTARSTGCSTGARRPTTSEDRRRATAWLRDCLSRLQAVERQALVLAYQHGLSHGDLAAHLQKPLGTVKTLGAPRHGQPAPVRRDVHGRRAMKLADSRVARRAVRRVSARHAARRPRAAASSARCARSRASRCGSSTGSACSRRGIRK